MPKTTLPFLKTDQTEWIKQLHKELQNHSELLIFKDDIEGLEIDLTQEIAPIGIPPRSQSPWKQIFQHEIEDETIANQILLQALMQGATGLMLSCKKENCDWVRVLQNIEVRYIDCWIIISDSKQLVAFEQASLLSNKAHIEFLLTQGVQSNYFTAYDVQQIGATMRTQLGFLLLALHRSLENNQLQSKYFFELSVGTQYFLEIAKLRAFRHLITRLEAIHQVEIQYELIIKTGFTNKSLKDPFTNLLRQATEALSAVMGGCDALCIPAYDYWSQEGSDDFSRRMALNIGNLIQEEVLLKSCNDPLKNARIIEALTSAIAEQAWTTLIEADEFEDLAGFEPQIARSRALRIQKFKNGQQPMIGLNQFENTFETKVKSWAETPISFGSPYLIYELI